MYIYIYIGLFIYIDIIYKLLNNYFNIARLLISLNF